MTPFLRPIHASPLAMPPTRRTWIPAGALAGLLALAVLAAAPLAQHDTTGTEPFVAAYAASVLVVELMTGILLLSQFTLQRCRGVLLMALGYTFSGLLVIPWGLCFPGVFPTLIDDGSQATAAIAALRRLSLPLVILAYAARPDRTLRPGIERKAIGLGVAATLVLAAACTGLILNGRAGLPRFMESDLQAAPLWEGVPIAAVVLYLAGLALLGARRRTVLDVWMMVVLFTLLSEIVLISFLGQGTRLSLGWWAGRLFGLLSAITVLAVLVAQATTVQARLAQSLMRERRIRENRLTAMEALSASIAHEVNQPLASMVTNASAGVRWLQHAPPRTAEAQAALGRIVEEGHRASAVVTSIRTMFRKEAPERVALDLNALVEATLKAAADDIRQLGVVVQRDLDPRLGLLIGNAVQLRQVLANLVDNALDAMRGQPGPRILTLATRRRPDGEALLSIADTGTGLAQVDVARIFEPFVTTKVDGMGMGLMFCNAAVEAHGGRIWFANNVPAGAIVHVSLPLSTGAAAP